jgi:hypothetical protein
MMGIHHVLDDLRPQAFIAFLAAGRLTFVR